MKDQAVRSKMNKKSETSEFFSCPATLTGIKQTTSGYVLGLDLEFLGVVLEVTIKELTPEALAGIKRGLFEQWGAVFDSKRIDSSNFKTGWCAIGIALWMEDAFFGKPCKGHPQLKMGRIELEAADGGKVSIKNIDGEIVRLFGAHVGEIWVQFTWFDENAES